MLCLAVHACVTVRAPPGWPSKTLAHQQQTEAHAATAGRRRPWAGRRARLPVLSLCACVCAHGARRADQGPGRAGQGEGAPTRQGRPAAMTLALAVWLCADSPRPVARRRPSRPGSCVWDGVWDGVCRRVETRHTGNSCSPTVQACPHVHTHTHAPAIVFCAASPSPSQCSAAQRSAAQGVASHPHPHPVFSRAAHPSHPFPSLPFPAPDRAPARPGENKSWERL